jgi:hypothetical protein
MRAVIVIGAALALVGAAVGTATGAVTPFQQVVVVNAPSSPIPVSGTINVANLPTNQSVTVSNFPTTQAVSGTVQIGNAPAVPVAGKRFSDFFEIEPGFVGAVTVEFGQTINVTTLIVAEGTGDNYDVEFSGFPLVQNHEGNLIQNFTAPVAASSAVLRCQNTVLDCHLRFTVLGY